VLRKFKDGVSSDAGRATGDLFLHIDSINTHIHLSIYLSIYLSNYQYTIYIYTYILLVLDTLQTCVSSDASRGTGDVSLYILHKLTYACMYLCIYVSIYITYTYIYIYTPGASQTQRLCTVGCGSRHRWARSLSIYIVQRHTHTHPSIHLSIYLSIYMTYTYTCILLVLNILQDCVPSDAGRGTGELSLYTCSTQTHIHLSIYLSIYVSMYLSILHIHIYIYYWCLTHSKTVFRRMRVEALVSFLSLSIYIVQRHTHTSIYSSFYLLSIYMTYTYTCILLVLNILQDCVPSDAGRGTGELSLYTCSTQTHINLSIYLSIYVSMYLSILHIHIYILLVLNTLQDCVPSGASRGTGELALSLIYCTQTHTHTSIYPSFYLSIYLYDIYIYMYTPGA